MGIPKRSEWQSIRDGEDVPKGAGKGSVGDTIDKVNKALAGVKSADDRKKAIKVLESALATIEKYKESIKKQYPKFVSVVDEKVIAPIAAQKKDLVDFEKNRKIMRELGATTQTVIKAFRAARKKNDHAEVVKTKGSMMQLLKAMGPQAYKCGNIDLANQVVWTNISKFCTAGALHAGAMQKTLDEYKSSKDPVEQRKLETETENQVDEAIDTLNKIASAISPLC